MTLAPPVRIAAHGLRENHGLPPAIVSPPSRVIIAANMLIGVLLKTNRTDPMPAINRELLELTMTDCQLNEPESAQQLINILRESGCAFIYGKKHDPSPESRIRRGSIIAPRDFTHPLLARDVTSKVLQQKVGVGEYEFHRQGKETVNFSDART